MSPIIHGIYGALLLFWVDPPVYAADISRYGSLTLWLA